jgi:hypothetical protein
MESLFLSWEGTINEVDWDGGRGDLQTGTQFVRCLFIENCRRH